jgi:superfamily I DNA/RNA helicase
MSEATRFPCSTDQIQVFESQDAEIAGVSEWLSERFASGLAANEFGVFVRSTAEIPRAREALDRAKLPFAILDQTGSLATNCATLSTMHCAKGLEFRAVVVMACDDDIIPSQVRIESVGDESDLREVYDTERHLLYVACTRARDFLLVTGDEPASEFLADLKV